MLCFGGQHKLGIIIAFDEGEREPNLALGAWGRRSQAKEIEILWADHFLLAILNILPRSGVFRLVPRASREAFRLVPRAIKLGKLVYFFNPLQCCLKSSQVRLIKA